MNKADEAPACGGLWWLSCGLQSSRVVPPLGWAARSYFLYAESPDIGMAIKQTLGISGVLGGGDKGGNPNVLGTSAVGTGATPGGRDSVRV